MSISTVFCCICSRWCYTMRFCLYLFLFVTSCVFKVSIDILLCRRSSPYTGSLAVCFLFCFISSCFAFLSSFAISRFSTSSSWPIILANFERAERRRIARTNLFFASLRVSFSGSYWFFFKPVPRIVRINGVWTLPKVRILSFCNLFWIYIIRSIRSYSLLS